MRTTESILHDFVVYYMKFQREDGSFPPGHNGPYIDPESPVRNTAHILFLLSSYYQSSPLEDVKLAAFRAIEYLFSKESRPYNKSFSCRNKKNKDHCNGLIGQAWVMEALIKASEVFDLPDCYKLAEDVFFLHKWNSRIGVWHRVEVDGAVLSYDTTYNHQLWFAAVASQLKKTPAAQKQALSFLNKVAARVKLYPDGVIFHSSPMGNTFNYLSMGIMSFLREFKRRLLLAKKLDSLYSKSVGYHAFNLYAYAMLKEAFPTDVLWQSDLLHKIVSVTEEPTFLDTLLKSEFGYFYNVSGIEIAYAMEVLCDDKKQAGLWLQRQFKHTSKGQTHPLMDGAVDKNTAIARLYELSRLKGSYEV